MTGNIRCRTDQGFIADAADLDHIIADETVTALNQFQRCLTLADTALAHNQNTLAKYIDQYAVNADHRRHLDVQPADDLRHQIRSRLLRYHARNPIMVTQLQHFLLRCHAAAIYQTWYTRRQQFVKHFPAALRSQGRDVRIFHITDDLHTVLVKMVEKSSQLQCRTVHIRMHQHNIVRLQLRRHIAKPHLIDQFCYRHSTHTFVSFYFYYCLHPITSSPACHHGKIYRLPRQLPGSSVAQLPAPPRSPPGLLRSS